MDSLIIFGAQYLFAVVLAGALTPLLWLPRRRRPEYMITGLICGVFAFALTMLAGFLYFDPRPFTHGVHPLIQHAPDNGFPSDHTVLCFAAALVAYRESKPLGIILVVVAIVVGLCRVLSGVHTFADVAAGALIGILSALFGWGLAAKLLRKRQSGRLA